MTGDWPFADPRNVATITTVDVVRRGLPILNVVHHDDDGCWEFTGPGGAPDDEKEMMVVGLGEMVEIDPAILELADLPLGWRASRPGRGMAWTRTAVPRRNEDA